MLSLRNKSHSFASLPHSWAFPTALCSATGQCKPVSDVDAS